MVAFKDFFTAAALPRNLCSCEIFNSCYSAIAIDVVVVVVVSAVGCFGCSCWFWLAKDFSHHIGKASYNLNIPSFLY